MWNGRFNGGTEGEDTDKEWKRKRTSERFD
jgi:hypothetical protein